MRLSRKCASSFTKMIKLGAKTINCVFISDSLYSATYRFLVVKSKIPNINNNIIMESIETELFENIFPFKEVRYNNSGSKRNYEASSLKVQDDQETEIKPRKNERAKKGT